MKEEIMEKLNNADVLKNFVTSPIAAIISMKNCGGYVARFSVSFNYQGAHLKKDSGEFTAGIKKSIEIPAGATNIVIKAEEAWFIASWSTIFHQQHPVPVTKCYELTGTTLSPGWREVAC